MNIQGIVQHVLPVVARLEAAPPDRYSDPPVARAPLFPDNTDTSDGARDWSSPRLFLSSPTASTLPAQAPVPAKERMPPTNIEAARPTPAAAAPRTLTRARRQVTAPK